jgi:3-oxoacyl-[acyl-carrier-protein] synthase II
MEKRRVVVTGLGAVAPCGVGVDNFWAGLISGKSAVDKITHFDTTNFPAKIAAEVKNFDPNLYFDKKDARKIVRFIQFAIAASLEAVADSGLKIADEANDIGVYIGAGIGGVDMFEEQANVLRDKGPDRLSPFTVPYMIANMAAGMVSIRVGAKGPNMCIVTACASGTNSIGEAFHRIQRGDMVAMVAGGAEACISPLAVAGFCAARALTISHNDSPTNASRPFDGKRDGFVMGEGSGIVVLEELEHAKARGAKIYAEMIGYGASGDANHITAPAPEGEGAQRAIKAALKDANITTDQVGYINAHGTSTELNDKFETMAIKHVFGEKAYKIPISSNKSVFGHLLGAAGGVEAVSTVKTIAEGIIPPTINYEEKDPICDLDYVPNTARKQNVEIAISNSFGFGGQNGVIAFKKYTA